jgi:hypothetical protein
VQNSCVFLICTWRDFLNNLLSFIFIRLVDKRVLLVLLGAFLELITFLNFILHTHIDSNVAEFVSYISN